MTSKKLLIGLLLAITITISLNSNYAFADSTGDTPPTVADSTHPSISEFINENNAFVSDNNRATGFINFDQAYGAFGFDISIPDGSTINGITVKLEGRKAGIAFGFQCGDLIGSPTFSVRLSDPTLVGLPTGLSSFTGNTYTTTSFGTSDTIKILGSPIDSWGNTYQNLDNFWILVTAKCGLLITRMQLDQVTVDVDYTTPIKNGHKCSNCQQPSIGITSDGRRVVDGGITVNGHTMDADFYFTPFPLIQSDINEQITMNFVIWDDVKDNIAHVEVGLGKGKIGESFGKLESSMIWNRHVMTKEETVTYDDTAFKDVSMKMLGKTNCKDASNNNSCDLFEVKFTPVKAIVGDVVFGISIWDDNRNAMTTFFNEGLQVGTETDVIPEIEFTTPIVEKNQLRTVDDYDSVMTRNSPNFSLVKNYEQNRMEQLMKELYPQLFEEEPHSETIKVYLQENLGISDSVKTTKQSSQ